MDFTLDSNVLVIPRGTKGLSSIKIDMSKVYEAESRLPETSYVNPTSAVELTSAFNQASGLVAKYIGWINYEILQAEQEFDLCKAVVILDKVPEQAGKLKELGIKPNEDYRNALITRDPDCQAALDTLNKLKASKEFLEAKHKLFDRSYYSCRNLINQPTKYTPINTYAGSTTDPQHNFMGENETLPKVDEDVVRYYRESK
jgi:hypothetical protein